MKVKNKVILVTGGGSGIGRELVKELIQRGARVAAIDLNEKALQETKELLATDKQDALVTYTLNITDRTHVEEMPAKIMNDFGQIDGLINNAGIIQPFVKVKDLDYDAINRVMNVNFFGMLYMTKTFLPHLLQRPEAHIVNISSMGGFLPVPGQSVYGATKAAVKLLTEALSSEMTDTNVKITVVFPGAIGTNIMKNSGVDVPAASSSKEQGLKPLAPSVAAQIIIDSVEKDKVRVFVGKDSRFLDILYRISPRFATNLVTKQMKSLLD